MQRIAFLQPCSQRSGGASYSIRLREAQESDTTLQVLVEGKFYAGNTITGGTVSSIRMVYLGNITKKML